MLHGRGVGVGQGTGATDRLLLLRDDQRHTLQRQAALLDEAHGQRGLNLGLGQAEQGRHQMLAELGREAEVEVGAAHQRIGVQGEQVVHFALIGQR